MITNKDLADSDYVDFKAAIALKEIGFNLPTHTHYYACDGKVCISISSNPETWIDYSNVIDRPIIQKAVEWLRENHKVSLRISWSQANEDWFYDYLDLSNDHYLDSDDYYSEYNDAVNAGIIEICEYIKATTKNENT